MVRAAIPKRRTPVPGRKARIRPAARADAPLELGASALPALTETPDTAAARGARRLPNSAPAQPEPLPDGPWLTADGAVVGAAHLHATPPRPCQDAALADAAGRALAILADGAGSAALSHLGAAAVVSGVRRLCRTLEGELAATLDAESGTKSGTKNSTGTLARQIVTHATGIIEDLAEAHLRSPADFRCTLLVWLVGRQRAFWLKVGDGALVAEMDGACHCVGPAGKGEFANQTRFIDPGLEDGHWAWGEIEATRLGGLAAMSDGAAERLVVSDGSQVSAAMGKLLRGAAVGQVGRREIFGLLAEADFWKDTSGDDKALAMVARTLSST